jgi:hypothetical protein
MVEFVLTIPKPFTWPTVGNKVTIPEGTEVHGVDGELPDVVVVVNGEYTGARLSAPADGVAEAPAAGIVPVYLNNYNQATDLSGSTTQTTAGVFPDADTFVVVVTDIANGATALVLTGSAVTSATKIAEGGGTNASAARVSIWVVTSSGASDITFGVSAGTSLDRQIHVIRATGATAAGGIGAAAGGNQASSPYQATLGAAAAIGDLIVAGTLCRTGQATGITWGGSMTGNEASDVQQASTQHRSGVAFFIGDAATAYAASAAYDGNDGSFDWAVAIAAIKAA